MSTMLMSTLEHAHEMSTLEQAHKMQRSEMKLL